MNALTDAAREFLAQKRIAVAGVSRDGTLPANYIYCRLRDAGYHVFAVNPNAGTVEGDRAYHHIGDIPVAVDGVVIATPPEHALEIVEECAALGVPRVWMHRSFGAGSLDGEAVKLCHERGIAVIPGACPMMFCEPVDVAHKCFRFITGMMRGSGDALAGRLYFKTLRRSIAQEVAI
jgi:uncharacterized protein